jgi:SAM-dependent methyltransferase
MIEQFGDKVIHELRKQLTFAQGVWFDLTRAVRTSGFASSDSLTLVGATKSGFDYLPIRPARAREVLRDLPIKDHLEYVFVDLGSGKGRMLFLAAEFPFYSIEGVEFAVELHTKALENIARCRRVGRKCDHIRSTNIDAADYDFPLQNLVIYLFNPFGEAVLRRVLNNLSATLKEHPRHLILVLAWPDFANVIDGLSWLSCYRRTPHYNIYQSHTRRSPKDEG